MIEDLRFQSVKAPESERRDDDRTFSEVMHADVDRRDDGTVRIRLREEDFPASLPQAYLFGRLRARTAYARPFKESARWWLLNDNISEVPDEGGVWELIMGPRAERP